MTYEAGADDARADRRAFLAGLALLPVLGTAGAALAQAPARRLEGLFPIGFTPTTADDRIDYDGLAAQVTFCRKGGVHGVAWPQIASGWMTLTEAERMAGAEALLAAAKGGRTAVIIGVQSPDPAAVERYARHAERFGADGIICIPPAGVTDEAELLAYYQRVGRMTSLPLFIQAIGTMSVDLLVRMNETIPTCRYVKDEAGDPLARVAELRRRTGDRLKVFSGNGVGTLITEMELGFAGHCPYVSLSDVYASAYDNWHAGRRREAFNQFGAIQAASTMFAQNSPDVLIARGVFKPGTRVRTNPAPAGAAGPAQQAARRRPPANSPEEIDRILKEYLAPYLRA